ncbi:MAG: NAD(P)/FAD-dependent oxidoreductase [Clostridia bacterium]|nr:NAD(P)/FAD-dependent oxidoreductase [Clostridia bacterium]
MKKVIVIGGGVSGLSAGIYLKANGYDVELIEKNAVLGGACIGWERKGFYIDGCIHWLTGVNPENPLYNLWKETRALTDDTEIFYQEDLHKYVCDNQKTLTFWADIDKLENSLLEFAPEDKKQIKKLIKLIKLFKTVNPPCNKPVELMNLKNLLKVAFTLGGKLMWILRTSALSCKDFSSRFKNPMLRDIIEHFMAPNYNFMSMLYMLGHITAKDGGIPIGGSLSMVKRMEQFYLELGGVVRNNTSVNKISVENGVAKGVFLSDRTFLKSDWVVSTTPIEHCLTQLLSNEFHDKKFDIRLKDEKTYPIYTYTTAVIKCPINTMDKSLSINLKLKNPIKFDKEYNRITFRNYSYDKTLKAEGGYCIIQATIHGNDGMYAWWKGEKEKGKYKEQKNIIAEKFLELAKSVYTDVASSLEVIDVVTPCTYERYLNSRHGSFQGFIHTSKGKSLMHNGKIKGLKNFLLAGQWLIRSGGLPPAVMSGRFTAQRICHKDKIKFVTP